jgi:hypothetical protein
MVVSIIERWKHIFTMTTTSHCGQYNFDKNLWLRYIAFDNIIFSHIYKFNSSWFSSFFTIDIPFHIEIFKLFSKFFWPITCLRIFIRWFINICDQDRGG